MLFWSIWIIAFFQPRFVGFWPYIQLSSAYFFLSGLSVQLPRCATLPCLSTLDVPSRDGNDDVRCATSGVQRCGRKATGGGRHVGEAPAAWSHHKSRTARARHKLRQSRRHPARKFTTIQTTGTRLLFPQQTTSGLCPDRPAQHLPPATYALLNDRLQSRTGPNSALCCPC